MNPTTLLHKPSSVAVAPGDRLADLPNIGPFMVRRLQSVGVRSISELSALGPRITYLRLREAWPDDTSEFTLFALHAALQGRPWQDLDAGERKALVGGVGSKEEDPCNSSCKGLALGPNRLLAKACQPGS